MSKIAAQCESRFRPLLSDFNATVLASTSDTIYGLWPDLRLAFVNAAWFRFAAENRGEPAISRDWQLGRCLLDAIPQPIQAFFATNFHRSLAEARRWDYSYECSSDEVYRKFQLTAYPLGKSDGLLVVNSLKIETPYPAAPMPALEDRYCNEHGLATQCCHCRKFRRVGGQHAWDWVPEWIKHRPRPEMLSHGMCEMCYGFYYTDRKLAGEEPQNFSPLAD